MRRSTKGGLLQFALKRISAGEGFARLRNRSIRPGSGRRGDPARQEVGQGEGLALEVLRVADRDHRAVVFFPGQELRRIGDQSLGGLCDLLGAAVQDQLQRPRRLDPHRRAVIPPERVARSVPLDGFRQAGIGRQHDLPQPLDLGPAGEGDGIEKGGDFRRLPVHGGADRT